MTKLPRFTLGVEEEFQVVDPETREKINEMLSEACSQPLERVARDTQRDFWMSAEEAIEYGLVTQIVSARGQLEEITFRAVSSAVHDPIDRTPCVEHGSHEAAQVSWLQVRAREPNPTELLAQCLTATRR